jgi:hypothetical protein
MPKLFVTRIPNIPMAIILMDDLLSGLSLMALIVATRLFQMDGPD